MFIETENIRFMRVLLNKKRHSKDLNWLEGPIKKHFGTKDLGNPNTARKIVSWTICRERPKSTWNYLALHWAFGDFTTNLYACHCFQVIVLLWMLILSLLSDCECDRFFAPNCCAFIVNKELTIQCIYNLMLIEIMSSQRLLKLIKEKWHLHKVFWFCTFSAFWGYTSTVSTQVFYFTANELV